MSLGPLDADRPPERPRRGRRRADGPPRGPRPGRTGGGDGSREVPLVEDVAFDSYYGRPVVKAPPWKAPIAVYLFLGGVAGGSAVLGLGAQLTGRDGMRRATRLTALGALGVGTLALIEDLGRPERFWHMMRVAKISSPMSMGTWILSGFGAATGVLGAVEADRLTAQRIPLGALRPLLHGAETPAAVVQAGLGPLLASYTGALLGDTVVPTWSAGRHHLPAVFTASASLASGGAAMLLAPVRETRPARVLAVAGVAGDLVGMHRMQHAMHPLESEPLRTGRAGRRLRWAERLAVAGGIGALLGGRSRVVTAASGAALLAASALTRFGVLEAGLESVKDPRRVIEPQKARLAARRAAGITDDAITTAG